MKTLKAATCSGCGRLRNVDELKPFYGASADATAPSTFFCARCRAEQHGRELRDAALDDEAPF